jgi:hypothetical protein
LSQQSNIYGEESTQFVDGNFRFCPIVSRMAEMLACAEQQTTDRESKLMWIVSSTFCLCTLW